MFSLDAVGKVISVLRLQSYHLFLNCQTFRRVFSLDGRFFLSAGFFISFKWLFVWLFCNFASNYRNSAKNMNILELSEQEIVRRQSLEQMRQMGIDPYPAAEFPVTLYRRDQRNVYRHSG